MVVSLPAIGAAKPRRLGSFPCYTWVLFQVIGGITLYLAENDTELLSQPDAGTQDGIQLTQAGSSGAQPPWGTWWKGDLWAAASAAGKVVMLTPGSSPQYNPESAFGMRSNADASLAQV
jgi:hypothetical protein